MIASLLKLSRAETKELKDIYSVHKLVYSLFPGDKRDFLYLDKGGNKRYRYILIFSQRHPQLSSCGELERSQPIPEDFLQQDSYGFTVRLNPVRRRTADSSRCVPVLGEREIIQWFQDKQEAWGFEAIEDSISIIDKGVQAFQKGETKITHNFAELKGVLRVTDQELFTKSFCNGLGRGKAFGFGLLQIVPLRKNI